MNKIFYSILVAIGMIVAVPYVTHADLTTAATRANSDVAQADSIEGDMVSFVSSSANERSRADVFGNCTENEQDGNWQGNRRREPPKTEDYDYDGDHPQARDRVTPVSHALPPTNRGGGGDGYNRNRDRNRDDNLTPGEGDKEGNGDLGSSSVVTPEPTTMLILGLGLAGLAPLSLRGRKKN